jgi:hypothetical protein
MTTEMLPIQVDDKAEIAHLEPSSDTKDSFIAEDVASYTPDEERTGKMLIG